MAITQQGYSSLIDAGFTAGQISNAGLLNPVSPGPGRAHFVFRPADEVDSETFAPAGELEPDAE